jgi:HAD superfamily phosphatase
VVGLPLVARRKTNRRELLIIFDLDGVLVDVRPSYRRTIAEVTRIFTGETPSQREIQALKDEGGYNDDWKLTHTLVRRRGHNATYRRVKRVFQRIYLGKHFDGRMADERPMIRPRLFRALARKGPLAIFTGRERPEARHTLRRFGLWPCVSMMVCTGECVPKPHPDGLHQIMRRFPARRVVYLGDNVDDAVASRRARMGQARAEFFAVIAYGSAKRARAQMFRRAGARAILRSPNEINRYL